MHPLNPFFAIVIYAIALLTSYLLILSFKIKFPKGRNEPIDGLRGFLGLGVFIHHSSGWFQYFNTDNWDLSTLYKQFGQTSVSLFFMITSFLFISKLLNQRKAGFDWAHFFISRIYRLMPMYLFSIFFVILCVLIISNWKLNVELPDFLLSLLHWCFFTLYETPMINGVRYTTLVNGGVQWSLWYEWLFYFSLPIVAVLIVRTKPKVEYIIFGVIFITTFFIFRKQLDHYHIYSFLVGAIPPFILKYTSFHNKLKDAHSSVIALVCLFLITRFDSSKDIYCILLIAIVFTLIATGCTFWGILKLNVLKFLGEISYSTYLLHSILLFLIFYFGFGFQAVKFLSPFEYCFLIFSLTPALILISFIGFRLVEMPFIRQAKNLQKRETINCVLLENVDNHTKNKKYS